MEQPTDTSPFPRWKLLLAAWGAFAVSLFIPCLNVLRTEEDREGVSFSGAECGQYTLRFLKGLFVEDDSSYEMKLVLKSSAQATSSAKEGHRAKVEIYYALFALANAAMVISPAILALTPRRAAVLRKLRAPLLASAVLVASFFPHALLMTNFGIRLGALLWLASFALLAWGIELAGRDLRSMEEGDTSS